MASYKTDTVTTHSWIPLDLSGKEGHKKFIGESPLTLKLVYASDISTKPNNYKSLVGGDVIGINFDDNPLTSEIKDFFEDNGYEQVTTTEDVKSPVHIFYLKDKFDLLKKNRFLFAADDTEQFFHYHNLALKDDNS
jgi:hypothetical protein